MADLLNCFGSTYLNDNIYAYNDWRYTTKDPTGMALLRNMNQTDLIPSDAYFTLETVDNENTKIRYVEWFRVNYNNKSTTDCFGNQIVWVDRYTRGVSLDEESEDEFQEL